MFNKIIKLYHIKFIKYYNSKFLKQWPNAISQHYSKRELKNGKPGAMIILFYFTTGRIL